MATSSQNSKLGGKVLHSQTREVIANVMKFMEAEAKEDKFTIDSRKVRDRVSAACGISKRSLTRIKCEEREISDSGTSFHTPNKRRQRPKTVTGLDDFDLSAVRRIINNFYLVEKCMPTVKKIKIKLSEEINFYGSQTSVRRIIRKLGYKWKKTKTNKPILMERPEISHKRFIFLQKMKEFRSENRPIIYTDETYIHSTHVSGKGWSDDSPSGISIPTSKGKRLIILHAGGEMGFINNCLTMWKSGQTTGDYHHDMNSDNYIKWLKEKLIPNLPPRSVLVIDNASYHNVEINKCPNYSSRKAEMQAWLTKKKIHFNNDMLKIQLYELIKLHKPAHKTFIIDQMMEEYGHCVLRLPPYHPELNTIELIWAEVKNWVAAHNVTFKMDDVIRLLEEKFQCMSAESWTEKCKHTKKVEKTFMEEQGLLENSVERFLIQLGQDSDEDSSGNSTENDDGELSGFEDLD